MTTADLQPVILRTIVGSKAHGLARADSDTDYREVFVIPPSQMLALGRDRIVAAIKALQSPLPDAPAYDEVNEWLLAIRREFWADPR